MVIDVTVIMVELLDISMAKSMLLLRLFAGVVIFLISESESIFGDDVCNKITQTNYANFKCVQQPNRASCDQPAQNMGIDSPWNISKGDRITEQISHGKSFGITKRKTLNIWLEWAPAAWNVKPGNETFRQCPVSNCNILHRSDENVVHPDARLFTQGVTLFQLPYLESLNRTPDDIWIVHALESPSAAYNFQGLENIFNWTTTYRSDSTIPVPYAKWVSFDHPKLKPEQDRNYAMNKTKQVAMFVSNCDTSNDRLSYAKALSQHIQVDIYGDCGKLSCPKSEHDKCLQMLEQDYKFYLAFENSNCRQYITEKFFDNALGNNVLPVVMGAHPDDYKRAAPHHSYIHVEDFESPKKLAEFLHRLDTSDSLYNSYFKWKGTGSFIDTKFWCRLCAMLHDPDKPNLVVKELDRWWRSERVCLRADQQWTR